MLNLIKSFLPSPWILAAIGIACGYVLYLRHEVSALSLRLENCDLKVAALQSSNNDLKTSLDRQTAAVSALEEKTASRQRELEKAAQEAAKRQQEAQDEIDRIMAMKAPKEEIEQCRAARSLLVR